MHILKRVNPRFSSSVPNIFWAYFSVQETLVLSFDLVFLSKRGYLDHKNDILPLSRNLHILKRVNPWFWSSIPNIFRALFSVQETLVLTFDHVVLSKGGFLVHKNDILLYLKILHVLKRVNPWFLSSVPNIFRAYFSVQETLVLSFDHVVLSKGGFLVHINDILI